MPDARATNANSIEIGVLRSQMDDVLAKLEKIDSKLDTIGELYVRRSEFDLFRKNQWLERTLIVLVTVSLTFLVTNYLGGR